MKTYLIYSALFLAFTAASCFNNTEPEDPAGNFKVVGSVLLETQPIEGAVVRLANAANWSATTNSDGSFSLEGLEKGNYIFTVEKQLDNGRVTKQEIEIILNEEVTDIGQINLLYPPVMYPIDISQLESGQVTLAWSGAKPQNFIEYRLYRNENSGANDFDSDLIFTSTQIGDTVFIDKNFRTAVKNYYRAYILMNDSKSTGTNNETVEVPEKNLVLNSGFENSWNGIMPDKWIKSISGHPTFEYFIVTEESKAAGSRSLKINYIESQSFPPPGKLAWGGIKQIFSGTELIEGKEYTLSFWQKTVAGSYQVRLAKNGDLENPQLNYTVPPNTDWSNQTLTFTVEPGTSYLELWIVSKPLLAANGEISGYIDDLKIIK